MHSQMQKWRRMSCGILYVLQNTRAIPYIIEHISKRVFDNPFGGMITRISPGQIKIGMFVCGFGGSWFDHPFWRTKFVVASEADAAKIRMAAIPYVEIDEARGARPEISPDDTNTALTAEPVERFTSPKYARASVRLERPSRLHSPNADAPATLEARHREQITRVVNGAKATMRGLFDDARMGRAIRVHETVKLIDDIAVMVSRSPRTILDIVRLKNKDEYTFMHSVAVCALMINVAQFLGKNAADTRDYGQAGLLHDVGKMGIPEHILNKPGPLTDEEFAEVRAHPEHGFQLLVNAGEVSDMALDVCRHHHEKQNGTGYPFAFSANDISEVAAVGAICDVYDAMTSNRVYKKAWTPAEAVGAMWAWAGHFDRKLLFAFMQSIAIFPEGMLVHLRSNRLGLVKPGRRKDTGPRVVAFYSTRRQELIQPEDRYVADGAAVDSIVAPANPDHWHLVDWDRLQAELLGKSRQEPQPDLARSPAATTMATKSWTWR